MRIVFLHGLESGPHGSKYRALLTEFGQGVSAPDCEGLFDMETRIDRILQHLGSEPALLVGSSFGGLAAALICQHRPELVLGLVLCAPAFHFPAAAQLKRFSKPAVILHGIQDTVVPLAYIQEFSTRFGVPLIEVEDDHRLSFSLDTMITLTRDLQSSIMQA